MKQIYFFGFLAFLSFTANAQVKKESILLGGQLFYSNTKDERGSSTQRNSVASILLSAGKAIKDNKVIGITAGFTPERRKNLDNAPDIYDFNGNNYQLGVFYREYKTLGKGFYVFGEADASYSASNQTQLYQAAANNSKIKQRGVSIRVEPGLSYQLFRKMQVELSIPNVIGLGYSARKEYSGPNLTERLKSRQFSFSSNLSNSYQLGYLAIGFRFIL